MFLYAIRMSKKYTWEANNKRYVEFKAGLEVKGDGKCYFPCNDCRGLQTRRILRKVLRKIVRRSGMMKGGLNIIPW